ncbi:hypothetical protein [Xylophilus sp. GOD-11R]|uniref:hypothetical protein n=1 Tax=Xylophilus sp. GOD-11R TaxID=3089814 RepID=UPI00298CA021|nr:hypothetical protein [Xylophilus sp. GOD-11R]WPB58837.1 hypothetical protein R9X41_09430 [Xylophilus sp. GOD-11R]
MNKPSPSSSQSSRAGTDTAPAITGERAYENSLPGTAGNTPGERPAKNDRGVDRAMMQSAKTDAERGSATPADVQGVNR